MSHFEHLVSALWAARLPLDPRAPHKTNILAVPHLGELFDYKVCPSDRTGGNCFSVAAVAAAITGIERHFALNCGRGRVDAD